MSSSVASSQAISYYNYVLKVNYSVNVVAMRMTTHHFAIQVWLKAKVRLNPIEKAAIAIFQAVNGSFFVVLPIHV
jgi:hypothetical protein